MAPRGSRRQQYTDDYTDESDSSSCKKRRKENFKEVYLKDLISEAKKLGITKKELLDMISDFKEE